MGGVGQVQVWRGDTRRNASPPPWVVEKVVRHPDARVSDQGWQVRVGTHSRATGAPSGWAVAAVVDPAGCVVASGVSLSEDGDPVGLVTRLLPGCEPLLTHPGGDTGREAWWVARLVHSLAPPHVWAQPGVHPAMWQVCDQVWGYLSTGVDAETAGAWLRAGYTLPQYTRWTGYGWTLEQVQALTVARSAVGAEHPAWMWPYLGVSPRAAVAAVKAGLSPRQAAAQMTAASA